MIAIAATLALAAAVPSASSSQGCPDFRALDQEVDQKLLDLSRATSLADVKAKAQLMQPLERLDQGRQEGIFLVSAESGSGAVATVVVCQFDAQARLSGCKAERGRSRMQLVTEAQVERLAVGDHIAAVEELLCPAHDRVRLPHNKLALRYALARPADKANPTGQLTLTFSESGRLEANDVIVK